MDIVMKIGIWATVVVGVASGLNAALRVIAGITPTTKDDAVVDAIDRALGWVSTALDYLALNPSKSDARDDD